VRNYSEEIAHSIDQEIFEILEQAYNRARQIVTDQRRKLDDLTRTLLEIETVDRPQFEALMA
jgi:cell division protease FtsH